MVEVVLNGITIPDRYRDFEIYEARVELAHRPTYLCGVAVSARGGLQLTASAAASGESEARTRATWELLKRVAIYEHMRGLPTAKRHRLWAPARSNGVAIGSDSKGARNRARLELLERHYVLKHWFEGRAPEELSWTAQEIDGYWLRSFRFHDQPHVTGVFALPRAPSLPLAFGFASDESLERSLEKARLEMQQRLGFLYDEPLPAEPPPFAPTALYHQDFYLYPGHAGIIVDWLAGNLPSTTVLSGAYSEDACAIEYVDITPAYFDQQGVVVKAQSSQHIPLIFGRQPRWDALLPPELRIHPIA